MTCFYRSRNKFIVLSSLWIFFCLSECTLNESQVYPYAFWRCCESNGHAHADRNSTSSDGEPIGKCENDGLEVVLLPKQLFPTISTDLDHVEIWLQNSVDGLKCDRGRDYMDISIDFLRNETSTPVSVNGKEGFDEVAFSGNSFLDTEGNQYSPRHFCVSSRTTNKTRLVVKTCKSKCSRRHPCIPRCCGGPGRESILTSPPASHNESFLESCSKPSLTRNPWNPWTSTRLQLSNTTQFNHTRYIPHVQGEERPFVVQDTCELYRYTRHWLTLLEDGGLQLKAGSISVVMRNFCIDGENPGRIINVSDTLKNHCQLPEQQEVVIVYHCFPGPFPRPPPSRDDDDILTLPACSCLARPHDQTIKLRFPIKENDTRIEVPVRLITESLKCPGAYLSFFVELDKPKEELFFRNGSLNFFGSSRNQSQFCIKSVFHNMLGMVTCAPDKTPPRMSLAIWGAFLPFRIAAVLLYVAIAVVYFLRKDKDLVFRCSLVNYSITAALDIGINLFTIPRFFVTLVSSMRLYAFSWLSVLCFDVWLNITFLRPRRTSKIRLWCYVAFTLALPCILRGVYYVLILVYGNFKGGPASVYLNFSSKLIGFLLCVDFLFFLATAMKLWVVRHSSVIKNQRNTILVYFKLFLLVGLRCVIDIVVYSTPIRKKLPSYMRTPVDVGIFILVVLHPAFLFFVIVWDAETKTYLATHYPRVKRVLDIIGVIEFPVRMCLKLRRYCNEPAKEGINNSATNEIPLSSTHMYVHRGRVHPNVKPEPVHPSKTIPTN